MTLHAFGDEAHRRWSRIGGSATIVACEPAFAASALSTALTLRRAGTRFFAAIVMDDDRARTMRERSADADARFPSWDEIRLTLDAAGECAPRSADDIVGANDRASLLEFVRLSERLLATSHEERARIAGVLGMLSRETDIVAAPDADVPPVGARGGGDIVVYAPRYPAAELGMMIAALADVELPVTVVCATALERAGRVRSVLPAEAAAALAGARAIVDANGDDPGTALALARIGVPLVVSCTSGAAERLDGVMTYEPWNRRSVLAAVADALGANAPRVRGNVTAPELDAVPLPPVPPNAPPISIVVTTYNRRALLGQTLASIQRQTYPNLDIIVVNDAGEDMADVVAAFPGMRYLQNATNAGPGATRNRGAAAARGEFITFFDDDDEMFPDHIATLADVVLRSGLDVVYGQMINCFAIPAGPGRFVIDGLLAHFAVLDHADIQWGGSLATTALLFRRSLLGEIGGIDDGLAAAEDYEFWLRLAAGREWARTSVVTSMYFVRSDGTNRSAGGMERYRIAHEQIFAAHPSTRPLVNAGRSAMLQHFAAKPAT